MKVPTKYGNTICALNDKNTDQFMDNEEQLHSEMSNDGNEEIGGNSKARNMLKDDCGTSMEMNEINQSMNKQKEDDESQSTKANTVSPVSLQVNVQSIVKTCIENCDNHNIADKVGKAEVIMDNKLNHIPTVIDDGHEYAIFDEELVNEGSRKRDLSAFGYFVSYRMSIQELRYHLYRMRGKFRLKHILNNGNGVFVFKFDNLQGLNSVIESGPWIVNNKPMVVQKWDPNVNLDRTEPKTLPLWVKLMNLPLKAWSNMGLSALASRIGLPLIMDAMTTKNWENQYGNDKDIGRDSTDDETDIELDENDVYVDNSRTA
nr:zinc knuckle CX2CX4HX4C [Tanacetum cinerariifolium]